MTQQKISLLKSSNIIRDSFINHIKKSISSIQLIQNDFSLEELHNTIKIDKKLLGKGTDQSTVLHKAFYSTFDQSNFFGSDFWESYKKLCLIIVHKLKRDTGFFGEWAIQRYPTIRFQFPENVSVYEFHRDSTYSHPLGEINCFYACNECKDSSALHVEKNLGFEDYIPLNLNSGEYALLNTSIYKHGDFLNKTGKTRVSIDFRFIPESHLRNAKTSITKGRKFSSDSYFISESEMKNC